MDLISLETAPHHGPDVPRAKSPLSLQQVLLHTNAMALRKLTPLLYIIFFTSGLKILVKIQFQAWMARTMEKFNFRDGLGGNAELWLWADYERQLLYLTATAAAERYRHQTGPWASKEGDMTEAESFRGIFATQQSKWNINIWVALHGMGIVKRTCWIEGLQQLVQATFFFF